MGKINVETICPFCGKLHGISVNEDGYLAWREGELIQTALPELSVNEREVLVSGMCLECQTKFFDDDDYFEEEA